MGLPAPLNSRASSHSSTFRISHISERLVMQWVEKLCQKQTRAVVSLVDYKVVVPQVIQLRYPQTMKEVDRRQQRIFQVHQPYRPFRVRVLQLAVPQSKTMTLWQAHRTKKVTTMPLTQPSKRPIHLSDDVLQSRAYLTCFSQTTTSRFYHITYFSKFLND